MKDIQILFFMKKHEIVFLTRNIDFRYQLQKHGGPLLVWFRLFSPGGPTDFAGVAGQPSHSWGKPGFDEFLFVASLVAIDEPHRTS